MFERKRRRLTVNTVSSGRDRSLSSCLYYFASHSTITNRTDAIKRRSSDAVPTRLVGVPRRFIFTRERMAGTLHRRFRRRTPREGFAIQNTSSSSTWLKRVKTNERTKKPPPSDNIRSIVDVLIIPLIKRSFEITTKRRRVTYTLSEHDNNNLENFFFLSVLHTSNKICQ